MGLFVDGPACTIADLTDQDTGLLDTALSTGINVSTKLRLAVDEIGAEIALWLRSERMDRELVWRPILRTEQVVVTPSLKRWQTMQSLVLVYRDAYFSQAVDRYQGKWQEYSKLARDARESVRAEGLRMVNDPIPQAAAPLLGTTAGPQSGGTFYASIAWVNAANQEGAPSVASSMTVQDGELMAVSATIAPANAIGFNVYAGSTLDAMFRQNDIPLPAAGTFLYVPGQRNSGTLTGNGQTPEFTRPLARSTRRG